MNEMSEERKIRNLLSAYFERYDGPHSLGKKEHFSNFSHVKEIVGVVQALERIFADPGWLVLPILEAFLRKENGQL